MLRRAPLCALHAAASSPQRTLTSLPRLFASPLPAGRAALSPEESRHATRVLRLREGDQCELFDGDGGLVRSRLVSIDARGGATFEPCEEAVRVPWSGPRWDLAVAISGLSSRGDWLIEKASELGVHSFVPLLTEHSPALKQRRAEQAAEGASAGICALLPRALTRRLSRAQARGGHVCQSQRQSNRCACTASSCSQPRNSRTCCQSSPRTAQRGARSLRCRKAGRCERHLLPPAVHQVVACCWLVRRATSAVRSGKHC